jgi:flavin reductase (DIM6/NTAB) family NADH-FMN oxidoreductase RutF
MLLDPAALERRELVQLINGLVAPRPIAWVSTLAPDGARNLAPFSFFNAFSTAPPTVAVGPGSRQGVNKDSLRNIKATGEFVVNSVTEELARNANRSSAEFPPEVDEWTVAGVDAVACDDVAPPRIAQSPSSFECRVVEIVDLGPPETPTNSVIIGRITRIHVDESILGDGYRVDPDAVRLVGRMSGDLWSTTRHRFSLARPRSDDPAVVIEEHEGNSNRRPIQK